MSQYGGGGGYRGGFFGGGFFRGLGLWGLLLKTAIFTLPLWMYPVGLDHLIFHLTVGWALSDVLSGSVRGHLSDVAAPTLVAVGLMAFYLSQQMATIGFLPIRWMVVFSALVGIYTAGSEIVAEIRRETAYAAAAAETFGDNALVLALQRMDAVIFWAGTLSILVSLAVVYMVLYSPAALRRSALIKWRTMRGKDPWARDEMNSQDSARWATRKEVEDLYANPLDKK